VAEVATRLHFKLQLIKSPKAEVKEKVDKEKPFLPLPLCINTHCRNITTSYCLLAPGKTRKMIKDKSAKKDPEKFKEHRNKIMAKSHSFQKYSKMPGVKKKLVKGWNGMTLTDLASETSMSVDDLFEAVLGLEVTIMGHIDHGKTSLLDYLRKSSIVAGEAGGITQHIGAFSVQLEGLKKKVTIIDTPGHAAFTAMRTRGALSTDIVILIIDSCEGVLEQTRESLRIIRQARVPFIVALNKIDKVGSNLEAVAEQLRQEGVLLEDQGGEVQSVPISALKGTNIRQLVEAVLTQAELLELKGDPKGNVEGVVIEGLVTLLPASQKGLNLASAPGIQAFDFQESLPLKGSMPFA